MATRTRVYKTCDGCGMSELDGAIIVKTVDLSFFENRHTIDMCQNCEEAEKYICNLCHKVHDDDHPCEPMKHEIANYTRDSALPVEPVKQGGIGWK